MTSAQVGRSSDPISRCKYPGLSRLRVSDICPAFSVLRRVQEKQWIFNMSRLFGLFALQEWEQCFFQPSPSLSPIAGIFDQWLPLMAPYLCPGIWFSNKWFCVPRFSLAKSFVGISACLPQIANPMWRQSFAGSCLLWRSYIPLGQTSNALPDFSEHLKSAFKMSDIPVMPCCSHVPHNNFPLREVEDPELGLFFIHRSQRGIY